MKHKLSIALVLIGIFILGSITGAGIMRFRITQRIQSRLSGRTEASDTAAMGAVLELKLHLNSEQRSKVEDALRAHQPELAALRRTFEPQFMAIRERQWREIRPLLTTEQQKELDELISEQAERRKRLSGAP